MLRVGPARPEEVEKLAEIGMAARIKGIMPHVDAEVARVACVGFLRRPRLARKSTPEIGLPRRDEHRSERSGTTWNRRGASR